MEYRIIDVSIRGNVIRLYLSNLQDISQADGDDWDDAPYGDNAGPVYAQYYQAIADIALQLNYSISEPADSSTTLYISRDDFKTQIAPLVVITSTQWYGFSDYILHVGEKNAIKIYFGDFYKDIQNIKDCNVIYFKEFSNDDEKIAM